LRCGSKTTGERLELGIKDNLVRLIGVEDAADIIADPARALAARRHPAREGGGAGSVAERLPPSESVTTPITA
jgi:hypothetical protein